MKASATFLILLFTSVSILQASKSGRTNIVLVMCDNMGFPDIRCQGGEVQNPNIDRMTKEGMRCTQFYNIAKDRTEIHNLANKKPSLTSQLADGWQGWAQHTGHKVK
jgi:hypothetical protein